MELFILLRIVHHSIKEVATMSFESVTSLTKSPSEETLTILDLLALSQRTAAAEEMNENDNRVSLAASALIGFAEQTGIRNSTEPAEIVIIDLLANLMHLCTHCSPDDEKFSFDNVLNTARMHFEVESNEHTL